MIHSNFAVFAVIAATTTGAIAQSFSGQVESASSQASINGTAEVATVGFLIGDYDPVTNPGGTQTRPGLFGGSGNNPIPTSADFIINTDLQTQPSGGVSLELSTNAGSIRFDGLFVDLLNGSPGSTDLTVRLLYNTFNTINPSFIYPGGTPFEVDVGEVGNVSRAELIQTEPGEGMLIPTADPDVFDFTATIFAELNLTISVALPDSDPVDNEFDALPVVVPLVGQAEVLADGSLRLTIQAVADSDPAVIPIDSEPLPPIPLELPTLGTSTASVLLNLTPESLTVDASVTVNLTILAEPSGCLADWNNDGQVNFFDIVAYLDDYNSQHPSADLAEPFGVFNFFDIVAFLDLYNQGCP
ncbi:MAG: hypothetical protein LAT64_03575 [Phycisphaerales bacterium]|nr:hypothetical protein [Planctomycetota bacterium]MCH8507830.1 hypothetical protein [Phycisphaerales bacterium]